MKYTIFYSWQSDLENKLNRSFIEDSLHKAAKSLSKNKDYNIDTIIDRDTSGLGGSPSIVDSITGKIANSDVFVCDISIINSKENGKKTPNPNVLFELGFASAILGWERIIMIQNSAFGGIENLPFDLRGRRVLQYNLDESQEKKSEEKAQIVDKLVNTFKSALIHYSESEIKKDRIIWWGQWKIESKIKMRGGILNIFRVSSNSFLFNIDLWDGARTGRVEGKAQILTPHSAFAKVKTFEENGSCFIVLRRRIENDTWWIDVEVGENCHCFHGHGASFEGSYKHQTEQVVNYGLLDELDLNELQRMTGKFMPVFLDNFQKMDEGENFDEYEASVVLGTVKGMHTIMESIVVSDVFGNLWCAFLDPDKDVVRYFSNTAQESKSVGNWLARFIGKTIIKNENNHKDEMNIDTF